jgi:hypothetical protein
MLGARTTRSLRALAFIVTGAILWTSIVSVALAADKTFSASVSPAPLVAGASYGEGARATSKITLTIVNESNQSRLGSANVTAPAGILVTAVGAPSVGTAALVGGVIQLRNLDLAPGASVSVAISARVECGANHGSYVWSFVVKQANDFKGTGNDLAKVGAPTANTVTGNCAVVFSKQPKSAEKSPTAITNKIYDPSGDPVTATVKDGAGVDTVAWWSGTITLTKGDDPSGGTAVLGGSTSGQASGGSVTFAPTIDRSASGYSLNATPSLMDAASTGTLTTAVESANFNIVDDATICDSPGHGCSASAGQGQKTQATVDASTGGATGDLVILSIADPTITLDCAGYTESSDVIAYNVTGSDGVTPADRAKLATFTLLAQFVTKSASKYEVCYTSNQPFVDKNGNTVTTGLLPDCANRNPVLPCVVSKALDKFKNLVLVVSSPPGDPAGKF